MAIASGGAHSGSFGKRRHRRNPVMSEINVTPMVDVMLVLLIIFMVSAPLLTVGVPIDLPQTQASSLDQADKEPLAISVNTKGQVFLQNTEIQLEELVPKLQAISQARGGNDERIYVRGDKTVDYGTVMRVMGRLSAAGFRKVALVTEVEQGSVKLPEMKTGLTISAVVHAALLLWGLISFAARPLEAKPNDALPIDIISDKQFSEITKGVKNGAKDKPPAPLVEKIGDAEAGRRLDAPRSRRRKSSTRPRPTRRRRPPEQPPSRSRPRPSPKRKSRRRSIRSPRRLKKEEAKKKAEDEGQGESGAAGRAEAAAAVRSDQDRGAARQARTDATGRRPARR